MFLIERLLYSLLDFKKKKPSPGSFIHKTVFGKRNPETISITPRTNTCITESLRPVDLQSFPINNKTLLFYIYRKMTERKKQLLFY